MNKKFTLKVLPRWMGIEKDDPTFILNNTCLRIMWHLYDNGGGPVSLCSYKSLSKTDSSTIDAAVVKLSNDKIITTEIYSEWSDDNDLYETYISINKPVMSYLNIEKYVMSYPE